MIEHHHDLTRDLKHCVIRHDSTVESRLRRVLTELKTGFAFLETFQCEKSITVFGSARAKTHDRHYKMARRFTALAAEYGFSIITGGGPGIMEAANRGAFENNGRSAGVNIHLPSGERKNPYVSDSVGFYYFFNRKVILAYTAEAFVFFPGGFGTMDELFEISTLVATKKIEKDIPVILIGKKFWKPLYKFIRKTIVGKYRYLSLRELKTWMITDDLDEAMHIIASSKGIQPRKRVPEPIKFPKKKRGLRK